MPLNFTPSKIAAWKARFNNSEQGLAVIEKLLDDVLALHEEVERLRAQRDALGEYAYESVLHSPPQQGDGQ